MTQRQVLAPHVSLDDQLLTLLLDNNRVAVVPLGVLPRLASATCEEAHNYGWNSDARTITWHKIDLTVHWDDLLAQAVRIRRPRLNISVNQVGTKNLPGVNVMYGKWQARLSWGQIAFWKEHQPLFWWLNPLVWRDSPYKRVKGSKRESKRAE